MRQGSIPLLLLLAASMAGCTRSSGIEPLGQNVYGIGTQAQTNAIAARRGVEEAQAYCQAQQREMIPVRSHIADNGYDLAFRCDAPRPVRPAGG